MPICKLEAEQSVVGAIIIDNNSFDDISDIITTGDFYDLKNRIIFEAILKLIHQNIKVDFVTLSNELKKINMLEEVGGDPYICELLKNTPSCAGAKYYAAIVKQAAHDRALLEVAQKIIASVESEEEDRLDKAQQNILAIAENKAFEPMLARQFMPAVFSDLIDRANNEPQIKGLQTGYKDLDKLMGLKPGEVTILAARPSMGKSLISINIAQYLTIEQHKTVLFFSLEMTKEAIGNRLLTAVSGIETNKVNKGILDQDEVRRLGDAYNTICNANFIIDDSGGLSVMDARAKSRRIKRKFGLDFIIIDYLQLMKKTNGENENIRVGNLSRELKLLAKELSVPILVLSQLNRDSEKRINRSPILADLRDSGAIEQDADIVLFIDRPEKYDETAEKGLANIVVAKNREGETGKIKLTFRGNYSRFENYSQSNYYIAPINTGGRFYSPDDE